MKIIDKIPTCYSTHKLIQPLFKRIMLIGLLLVAGCAGEPQKPEPEAVPKNKIKVAVLVYPGVELLDFSGPMEVFSNSDDFYVYTVSRQAKPFQTKNNALNIQPDFTFSDAPQPDILVLPGAPVATVSELSGNEALINWVKSINAGTRLSMSVCTGVMLLAKAGLLEGKTATTHAGAIDDVQQRYPDVKFVNDARFVADGKIITTAGVSAGIDGALYVVQKLKGMKEAMLLTAIMEYDKWDPESGLIVGAAKHDPTMDHNRAAAENTSPGLDPLKPIRLTADTKDVVCGMVLKKGESKYYISYHGKVYHFCSGSCKKLFARKPELYVQ